MASIYTSSGRSLPLPCQLLQDHRSSTWIIGVIFGAQKPASPGQPETDQDIF